MNGKIAPSAWARLPESIRDDLIGQAQWFLHVRRDAWKDRIYDTILHTLGVDTNPAYQPMYRDYVHIHSEFPYAGSEEFACALRDVSRKRPDDKALAAIVQDIDTIHDTAMSIAEARLRRGQALSR